MIMSRREKKAFLSSCHSLRFISIGSLYTCTVFSDNDTRGLNLKDIIINEFAKTISFVLACRHGF